MMVFIRQRDRKMTLIFGLLLINLGSVVEGHGVSGQLYSSLTHMNDLFIFDNMVGEMLPFLPSYIQEVARYKESYTCLYQDTARIGKGQTLDVAITGNPLHLFSVIKRLVLYWPAIRKSISAIAHEKSREWMPLLTELENRTVLPSTNDLRGAALALARIQQVYWLPIPSLATGTITNVSTCVRLNVYDCIWIANASYHEGQYANSWQWYRYASAIAQNPEIKSLIAALKVPVAIEHDANFIAYDHQFFPDNLSENELQTPWDTRYSQLCRGVSFMDEERLAGLKCYVSSRGSHYLTLQPIRYEHLHNNPEMYMFYDVLSDKEMQAIKDTATSMLERSVVISSDKPVQERRVSQTAWLKNDSHPYLPGIARRISAITGLHVFEGSDEDMAGENLQVLSYGIGGHYSYHMDALWKDFPEDQWITFKEEDTYAAGDRMATWMFYLSEVEAGGRTAFPYVGVSVEPVKGSAVFWYSIKKNGNWNLQSEHGGCPVLLGHKWVANKWIRENHNFLRRPCAIDSNE